MNNPIELNQISYVWLVARIIPVRKKQPVEVKYYQTVSILLILSKMYERVVTEHLPFLKKK